MEAAVEMVVKYGHLYVIKLLFHLLKHQFPVLVVVQVE
jgi:hypothetical protein